MPAATLDPDVLRIAAAIHRLGAVVIPMLSAEQKLSKSRRDALLRIEELLETQPSDIDEARELLQQVRDQIENALGVPAKDVI